MIQAELRIAAGNKQGSSISLPQGKFLVGREEDCHLRPNSDLVSRHHCVFTVDDFSVRLRDLGSTNGTFVNGERLKGAVMLKQGDRVLIGKLDFEVILQEDRSTMPASGVETVMIAGSPEASSASTQFSMPVLNLSKTIDQGEFVDVAAGSLGPETPSAPEMVPASSDTQYMPQQPGMMPPGAMPPGYGMPVGYPQQQQPYMQNPYGYPGYPQQMPQMPMGGYYGQPMGYPQMQMPQQMMPPGYGMPQSGMMMPQQMMPEAAPEARATPASNSVDVRLPDPATSGAKAPPPPAAAPPAVEGAPPAVHIPTAAADIIKQYQTRR